jgi:hypothetical protein
MLADKFKNGKQLDIEKSIKAYVLKHYGRFLLTLRFKFIRRC